MERITPDMTDTSSNDLELPRTNLELALDDSSEQLLGLPPLLEGTEDIIDEEDLPDEPDIIEGDQVESGVTL